MPLQIPYVGTSPQSQKMATPIINVDAGGEFLDAANKKAYALATAGTLTPASAVRGGDYIWACEASAWNSATATLQILGQDGTTWRNMRNAANTADVTMTANGQIGVGIGQGASLRVILSGGTPTAFYSNLAGL